MTLPPGRSMTIGPQNRFIELTSHSTKSLSDAGEVAGSWPIPALMLPPPAEPGGRITCAPVNHRAVAGCVPRSHSIWGTLGSMGFGASHGESWMGTSVARGTGGQVPGFQCGTLPEPGVTPGAHVGHHEDGLERSHPLHRWASVWVSGGCCARGTAPCCADAGSCPDTVSPDPKVSAGTSRWGSGRRGKRNAYNPGVVAGLRCSARHISEVSRAIGGLHCIW